MGMMRVYGNPTPFVNDYRLSLATATPVTVTDQLAKSTLYWTPCGKGKAVTVFDGVGWRIITPGELPLDLTGYTNGKLYDIWLNPATPALDSTVWTNSTTRATALALQDGRYVKTGALTLLWLGTILMSATSQTQDANGGRYVVNAYNQIPVGAYLDETADYSDAASNPSWATATATLTFITLGGESPLAHGAINKGSSATQDAYWRFNFNAGTYYYAGSNTASVVREGFNQKALGALAAGAHTIAIETQRVSGSGTFTNRPTTEPTVNWRRLAVHGLVR